MTRLSRLLWLLGVFVVLAAPPASAQSGLETFYGTYVGTGVSSTPDSLFFAYTDRDMDVEIGPDGDGFFVSWTTVIRELADPEPRRRESRVVFDAAARDGLFHERGSGRPVDEGVLRWAHVDGDTLRVHILGIGEEGGYGLQSYSRTLRGDRMALEFVSVTDGQQRRLVTGDMTRQ